MKPTKKQLKQIQEIEKKVSEVCDTKKTIEVTLNDKGVIINKETGEPHFGTIDIDKMKKLVKEKKSRDIEIALSFGKSAPSLKIQIEKQRFVIPKGVLKDAEQIRNDLHDLKEVGILKNKELMKCFKRLSKNICKVIIDFETKEGEIAIHKSTKQFTK